MIEAGGSVAQFFNSLIGYGRAGRASDIPQDAAQASFPLARRFDFLRQHGNFTLAYSAAVQKGLDYFGNEHGFIAYKAVGRSALALADPVAPLEHRRELIRQFVEAKSDVSFWQVSRPTAEILSSMGFAVNEMGTDSRLDLTNYKRKSLRHDFNRAAKDGYVTKESTAASVGIDAIRTVSDRWRQTRTFKEREVAFLNRPVVLDDEPDVRKFFTFDRDGTLVAFAFYDPVYQDGEVIGYSTSFKRWVPEADSKICNAILHSAIETFRAEGRKRLLLGLSPDGRRRGQGVPPRPVGQWWVSPRLQQQTVQPLRLPAAGARLAQARLQGRGGADLLRLQDAASRWRT